MENPHKVNLSTSEQVRSRGWQIETRDADGHLIRTSAPFDKADDITWLIDEAMADGNTVTIWPPAKQPE